jgi:hypothetical protein
MIVSWKRLAMGILLIIVVGCRSGRLPSAESLDSRSTFPLIGSIKLVHQANLHYSKGYTYDSYAFFISTTTGIKRRTQKTDWARIIESPDRTVTFVGERDYWGNQVVEFRIPREEIDALLNADYENPGFSVTPTRKPR